MKILFVAAVVLLAGVFVVCRMRVKGLCCRGNAMPMLKPEEFAVLPWSWITGDNATFTELRECGFNLAGFVKPEALDAVRRAGLKGIVFDEENHVTNAGAQLDETEIGRRVDALVKRVAKHRAAFGYYLRDEPAAGVYPGLRKWADAYRKTDPDALLYINLFPNYATPKQLEVPTYAQYLEDYVQTVRPKFISYDHYALMDDGSLRAGYFANLEAVRATALRHRIPFWNIVLANAHFNYAEPTDGGLRFQLYTTLAYGGRGISYFTYVAPSTGNYRLAPIDPFGNKTPTWYMLRNVNLQLHRLGPVYLTLRSVNVFHHPDVPEGCSGIRTSRWLKDTIRGGSLLIGEFEGPNGQPFVMVVNKDLHRSTNFHLEFKELGPVQMVNAYTGQFEPWQGENDWLAPGQGMLLCLGK